MTQESIWDVVSDHLWRCDKADFSSLLENETLYIMMSPECDKTLGQRVENFLEILNTLLKNTVTGIRTVTEDFLEFHKAFLRVRHAESLA